MIESRLRFSKKERKYCAMTRLKFITLEKLLEMKENKDVFTLVDALPEESYREGHIPGAINMPSEKIARQAEAQLDKTATIVTYCGSYACKASTIAARKLIGIGYKNVLDFKAGKKAWKDAGFEWEK
jgi:rhodanese-related sulfurtransferase